MSLAVISGGTLSAANTTITIATSTAPPSTGLVLIESEIIKVPTTDAAGTTWAGCTRAYSHSKAATHVNTTPIYKVHNLISQQDGILVVYEDTGTLKYKKITVQTALANLAFGFTAPAAMTDSTGGTPSATTPPTLIAVRTDTAAHVAADVATNEATINAYLNTLSAAVAAATINAA